MNTFSNGTTAATAPAKTPSLHHNPHHRHDNKLLDILMIELTLLNIHSEVTNDIGNNDQNTLAEKNDSGNNIEDITEHALSLCTTPASAARMDNDTQQYNDNEETSERLIKSVLRFIRLQDKYLALSSVLLKSMSYHTTFNRNGVRGKEEETLVWKRPVVELPRTKHKKPYIPPRIQNSKTTVDDDEIANMYPISISHQYPHCGLARLVKLKEEDKCDSNKQQQQQSLLLLGMDIVVFEPYNTRLYTSVQQYLKCFDKSFTRWEWSRIRHRRRCCQPQKDNAKKKKKKLFPKVSIGRKSGSNTPKMEPRSEQDVLKEFYVRWSMKEAYTKALGVGMGLDFTSFETKLLDSIDDGEGEGEGESEEEKVMVDAKNNDGDERNDDHDIVVDGAWDTILQKCKNEGIIEDTNNEESSSSSVAQNVKQQSLKVRGRVVYLTEGKDDELWDFWFVPLPGKEASLSSKFGACACVCLGPLSPSEDFDMPGNDAHLSMTSLTLNDLIEWHTGKSS